MLAERTSQILVHVIGEYVDTALAALGPTRMRYSRVIPAVRYLSSLMGERVARLC